MKILVTGASGFIGSQIVTDLLKAGHQVICCVRDIGYAGNLFPSCKIIKCDYTKDFSQSDWIPKLNGIDIVINAVGIFYHPNKKIIWKIHYDTPRALFEACHQCNIKRIIQISALAVEKYSTEYAKSKFAADEFLLKLPIPSIVLRPSLVYAQSSYGGSSLLRGLVGLPLFIPIPIRGDQILQPIYLPDLSRAIINLISIPLPHSIVLHTVCSNKITLKDILITLRQWLTFPKAFIIPIPLLLISIISFFGNLIPNSVLNSNGIKMLTQHNISSSIETDKFIQLIGFSPLNFHEGIFSRPSSVQDHWHSKLYFVKPLLQFSLAFLWIFTAICSLGLYPTANSYSLLSQAGIGVTWQPILLYGGSLIDLAIGIALLLNYQIKKICVLQFIIILLYSLIITLKLNNFWFHPFGPVTKNIPILISIYILSILETSK